MRALAFTLLASSLLACGGDTPPPAGPIDYTVIGYDYAFDIETRAAATAVDVRVDTGGDCLSMPLRAGQIADVTLDDEPVSGTLEGNILTVCGAGWEDGSEITLRGTLEIPDETWGDSQVGYSVTDDLEGQPFYYLVSWVGGCDRFGPCDSAPDRFAHYHFTVHHPSGYKALCPGTVTAGDTETTCDFTFAGGPTYSGFGVAASPSWTTDDLGDWGGVHATLYDIPSTGIADAIDTSYHADYLAWMIDQFGPYPYGDEIRFFTGPTYWNGFEHPGNIALADTLVGQSSRYANPLAHTINHEMTHMWAGDQTTLSGTYDFVWKEAMAEYLTYVFDDQRDPAIAAKTASAWKYFAGGAAYYPMPMDDPRPALLDYYGDAYGPGPMVLFHQLERLYSRDDVMAALAMLLGTERSIGVDDVKTALETTTGADLTNYFNAWVYGSGKPAWPRFSVQALDAGGGDYNVLVAQLDPQNGLYGCAFAVELTGDNPGESDEVWVDMGPDGKTSQMVTASPGFSVTGWTFDPHADCLAYEGPVAAPAAAQPRINPWVARRSRR